MRELTETHTSEYGNNTVKYKTISFNDVKKGDVVCFKKNFDNCINSFFTVEEGDLKNMDKESDWVLKIFIEKNFTKYGVEDKTDHCPSFEKHKDKYHSK